MKLFLDILTILLFTATAFVTYEIISDWYKERKKPKFYVIDGRKINKP